jgi:hypothetical protein
VLRQVVALGLRVQEVAALPREALEEVKRVRRQFASDTVLAGEPGEVARVPQQRRVGGRPILPLDGGGEIRRTVAARVQPGQDACPAGTAYRGGDERVLEAGAFRTELVQVRRVDEAVARAAQRVPALVVGEQQHDIRAVFPVTGGACAPCARGEARGCGGGHERPARDPACLLHAEFLQA